MYIPQVKQSPVSGTADWPVISGPRALPSNQLPNMRFTPLAVLLSQLLQHAMFRDRIEGAFAQVFTLALMLQIDVYQGVDQRPESMLKIKRIPPGDGSSPPT